MPNEDELIAAVCLAWARAADFDRECEEGASEERQDELIDAEEDAVLAAVRLRARTPRGLAAKVALLDRWSDERLAIPALTSIIQDAAAMIETTFAIGEAPSEADEIEGAALQ